MNNNNMTPNTNDTQQRKRQVNELNRERLKRSKELATRGIDGHEEKGRPSSDANNMSGEMKRRRHQESLESRLSKEKAVSSHTRPTRPVRERTVSSQPQPTRPVGERAVSRQSQPTRPVGERTVSSQPQPTRPVRERTVSRQSQPTRPEGERAMLLTGETKDKSNGSVKGVRQRHLNESFAKKTKSKDYIDDFENNETELEDEHSTSKNKKKTSKKNGSEAMALSAVSFVLNTTLTVLFYIIVVIAIVKASKTVYDFGYQIYGNVSVDAAPGKTVNVVIEDGETTMNVASKLELNKIIENKYSFYIRTKLSGKSIYPGTYQVNTSMNYQQILDVIADYDTALENKEEESNS